ncbi:MAG: flagellar biosynthesis anti-sigma factor FlgM [Rubrivivax sp.]|nr:flagellar biosynthesis anti-sigma factor FlgM [Rubrivivax sp.]MDH5340340.1 flagellar biosynthesis anti-sigma factor FlgM [Rubrivivax sp.]
MKIGPLDHKPAVAPTANERPAGRSSSADAGASASNQSVTVDLSAAAALSVGKEGEGSFDAAKVERIAQAIRDGKFEVNADVIADKLIANAQEVLGKAGG